MYKLSVTEKADNDLDEIIEHITFKLKNPSAATAMLNEINECYELLQTSPYMYEPCRDKQLSKRGYRKATIKNYVMIYEVLEPVQTVRIMRFFYGGRNYVKLL